MSLRATNIGKLDNGVFDVLIIGGGINGAVCAAALASRGARVALVDRGDFAGFTSMQSSNLVWGGVKYLENYEFALVRHLCMSRNRLIRSYPSNIKEIRFLLSVERHARYAPWFMGLGTLAYWIIGNFFTRPPRLVSRSRIESEEPSIDTSSVVGGVEYSDAYLVDNDSRFVFGFIRSALNVGAVAVNYMNVDGARREKGRWHVDLTDVDSGKSTSARARVLINAAGPFVDEVNAAHGIVTNHRIVLSKGIHMIVPRLTGHERVLAFFDDTERLFFVIPMGMRSVIGTTDTRVTSPHAGVDDDDREFLLAQINERLKLRDPLTVDDVLSERCGVRPLVVDAVAGDADSADWASLSRKHVIEVDDDKQHVTIFGGKLTDALNIGAEIGRSAERLGLGLEPDHDDWYGEPPPATRTEFFRQARLMGLDKLRRRAAFETLSTRLWRRYGLRAFSMLEAIRDDPSMAEEVIEGADYLRVELYLAAQTEMVTKLEDFLRRRSKISLVLPHDAVRDAAGIREACQILFGDQADRRYAEYLESCDDAGLAEAEGREAG